MISALNIESNHSYKEDDLFCFLFTDVLFSVSKIYLPIDSNNTEIYLKIKLLYNCNTFKRNKQDFFKKYKKICKKIKKNIDNF